MKSILNKLKSKVGESLVESLAAILIFTMASIVMYSMVTTAGDINMKAKEMDEQNQEHLVAVEKGESPWLNAENAAYCSGSVTFTLNGSTVASEKVDVYGGEDGSLYTYFFSTRPLPPSGTGG